MEQRLQYVVAAAVVLLVVGVALAFLFQTEPPNSSDRPYRDANSSTVDSPYRVDYRIVTDTQNGGSVTVTGESYVSENGSRQYVTWRTVRVDGDGDVERNLTRSVFVRDGSMDDSFVRQSWAREEGFNDATLGDTYDVVDNRTLTAYRYQNGTAFPRFPLVTYNLPNPSFEEAGETTVSGETFTKYRAVPRWATYLDPPVYVAGTQGTVTADEQNVFWNASLQYTAYEGVDTRGEALLVRSGVVDVPRTDVTMSYQRTDEVETPCPTWVGQVGPATACLDSETGPTNPRIQ